MDKTFLYFNKNNLINIVVQYVLLKSVSFLYLYICCVWIVWGPRCSHLNRIHCLPLH